MNQQRPAREREEVYEGSYLEPYYPKKPKNWRRSWESMKLHQKIRFLKIYGPISKIPASVEIANLINEAKVEAIKRLLALHGLNKESLIIRISISPNAVMLYEERVKKACLKHAEKLRKKRVSPCEYDDTPDDDDGYEEFDKEPRDVEGDKMYGARKLIKASRFEMMMCSVQFLKVGPRKKTSTQFSANLTYGTLLEAIDNFKSIDQVDIERLYKDLRRKCDEILWKANPLRSRRIVFELEVFSYIEEN